MKKRIVMDIVVDSLTTTDINKLKAFKLKAEKYDGEDPKISYHDCGHEEGKACVNEVHL